METAATRLDERVEVIVDRFGVTSALWLGAAAALLTTALIYLLGAEKRQESCAPCPGAATVESH